MDEDSYPFLFTMLIYNVYDNGTNLQTCLRKRVHPTAAKAVILGSNYYTGLSIIRGLGSHGIHTVAMDYSRKNAYGARSKYLTEQIIVPHYRERNPQVRDQLPASRL